MKQYLHPLYQKELDAYSRFLRLKNYSNTNTYQNYMGTILKFLCSLDCHLSDITREGFEHYLLTNNWGQSRQAQVHGALGNFFRHVMHRPEVVQYAPFATAEQKLPDTYTEEEIQMLLSATGNTKHKLIILLQYDCGLRVNELPKIDYPQHLDLFRNCVKIVSAKGKKDRFAHFGNTTRALLNIYLREYKPQKYLFVGQQGERYTIKSIQNINKAAKAAAGIHKRGCTHILRHTFAQHLYEGGLGLEDIGARLGHAPGSPATQIYARMNHGVLQRQPSPADKLNLTFQLPVFKLKAA